MAITTINFDITSVYDSATDIVTVTDNTTYPVASNLVYLPDFSAYKASGGDESLVVTPDNVSDNLITSWTYTPLKDGWHRNIIVAAFTEATIIAENSIFTLGDTIVNSGNYYYYNDPVDSTDDLITAPTKWTALTASNVSNVRFSTNVDTFITQDTQECLEEEQIRLGRELLEDCGCSIDCDTETKIRTWLDSSILLFNDGDQAGAQKMIEKAIDLCNCI